MATTVTRLTLSFAAIAAKAGQSTANYHEIVIGPFLLAVFAAKPPNPCFLHHRCRCLLGSPARLKQACQIDWY